MDRLIATTAKDGAYTVTVSGLQSWAQAERVAVYCIVKMREGTQEWAEAHVERVELLPGAEKQP